MRVVLNARSISSRDCAFSEIFFCLFFGTWKVSFKIHLKCLISNIQKEEKEV